MKILVKVTVASLGFLVAMTSCTGEQNVVEIPTEKKTKTNQVTDIPEFEELQQVDTLATSSDFVFAGEQKSEEKEVVSEPLGYVSGKTVSAEEQDNSATSLTTASSDLASQDNKELNISQIDNAQTLGIVRDTDCAKKEVEENSTFEG